MQSCSFQHLDCTFTTKRIHNWASFALWPFFLQLSVLALHSSPVAIWTPSSLGGSSSGIISFCIFVVFMGFSWQECWSGLPSPVDHACQNSSLSPVCLGWPCTEWLIASLSYTSLFAITRLWSMKGDLNGKEIQKRGDVCIHTADCLCCTVDTNTTLWSNSTPIIFYLRKFMIIRCYL